jgi:predicted acyltransferase
MASKSYIARKPDDRQIMTTDSRAPEASFRFHSLDFFRGLTMFLLVAESAEIYDVLMESADGTGWLHTIGIQFHHVPWDGLRFWDLIQPFFMFIVGVAIPFAVRNRHKKGDSDQQIRQHVFKRALVLLLLGWGLYAVGPEGIVFRFQNVLAQLSVTYLVAYLIMHKSPKFQIGFSLGLILLTEIIYRTFWVDGFNHPFVPNENFGTWLDLQYGGEDLRGHWVSFNAIPTTAHTIWGVLAGQLLMSDRSQQQKLKMLLIAGVIGVVLGYTLSPITPIIKRICTSSFIFASGGWALLALALSYYVIDMRNWTKGMIFTMVGMNSLFIYLFANIGGANFLHEFVGPYVKALLGWLGEWPIELIASALTLFLLWYLCYWLYQKKIFVKI